MARTSVAALLAVVAIAVTLDPPPAEACSCAPPEAASLLGIGPGETGIPLDVKLFAYVATHDHGELAIRPRGGARLPATVRRAPVGEIDLVELTPSALLAPRTEYEVFVARPAGSAPQAIVVGLFTTGDARDDAPPVITSVGRPRVVAPRAGAASMCGSSVVHFTLDVEARDGSPDDPKPFVAIWGEKNGTLTTDRVPDAMSGTGTVGLGQSHACSWLRFPLPRAGGTFSFAVAAVDRTGKQSAPRRMTVTLPKAP